MLIDVGTNASLFFFCFFLYFAGVSHHGARTCLHLRDERPRLEPGEERLSGGGENQTQIRPLELSCEEADVYSNRFSLSALLLRIFFWFSRGVRGLSRGRLERQI